MTQPRTDSTDDQLLGHARRLSLEFSGRAAEFDLARTLGQDASDAMAQAGFYRLFVEVCVVLIMLECKNSRFCYRWQYFYAKYYGSRF